MRYRFLPYQVGSDLSEKPAPKREVMLKKLGEKKVEQMGHDVRNKLSSIGYHVYVPSQSAFRHAPSKSFWTDVGTEMQTTRSRKYQPHTSHIVS